MRLCLEILNKNSSGGYSDPLSNMITAAGLPLKGSAVKASMTVYHEANERDELTGRRDAGVLT